MCGIDHFMKRFIRYHQSLHLLHYALQAAFVGLIIYLRLPAALFLLLAYFILLIYLETQKRRSVRMSLRGLISVMLMLLVGLINYLLFRRHWYDQSSEVLRVTYDMRYVMAVTCMLISQMCILILGELSQLTQSRRWAYLVIFARKIAEAAFLGHYMTAAGYTMKQMPFIGLSIVILLTDYYLIYCLEMKRFEDTENTRRISLPTNREEYYARMEEEHLQIRRLYHDMKNQLMILEGSQENQSEAARSFIERVSEELSGMENFYHTGNDELNRILSDCRLRARGKHIDFDVIFQENCLSFMDQEDINTIFVNAIVNAIEACEKITDGERSIQIQVGSRLNDIILSFKNTKPIEQEGEQRLKTSKQDKRLHGLGIPSIQRAVNHYKGFMTVSEEEQYFQMMILFVREEPEK